MKRLMLFVALVMLLPSLPFLVGCGGSEGTVSPETMEENRQKAIERAKHIQEETSKN